MFGYFVYNSSEISSAELYCRDFIAFRWCRLFRGDFWPMSIQQSATNKSLVNEWYRFGRWWRNFIKNVASIPPPPPPWIQMPISHEHQISRTNKTFRIVKIFHRTSFSTFYSPFCDPHSIFVKDGVVFVTIEIEAGRTFFKWQKLMIVCCVNSFSMISMQSSRTSCIDGFIDILVKTFSVGFSPSSLIPLALYQSSPEATKGVSKHK